MGLSLELMIPDDISFPYMHESISPQEIESCKEGALQGNGKASLIVADYYREIMDDVISMEYWYRIGAQNGNIECQRQYSHILNEKSDIYHQERGIFWLNRSTGMTGKTDSPHLHFGWDGNADGRFTSNNPADNPIGVLFGGR
jgi:hypothetical protein